LFSLSLFFSSNVSVFLLLLLRFLVFLSDHFFVRV
jgi:hypothetical protein